MTGSIRARSPGHYEITVDVGRDVDGKRKRHYVSVSGKKKDAERKLTEIMHSIGTGTFVEQTKMTLGEYLAKWLADVRTRVSAKSYERYAGIMNVCVTPRIGLKPLIKLTPLDLSGLYAELLANGRVSTGHKITKPDRQPGLSARTVRHVHVVLRGALRQAVLWRLIVRNPSDAVVPPRPPRRDMRALTDDEVGALVDTASTTRLFVPIVLAVFTGMRRGEILGLRWQDVDFEARTAVVRQTMEQTKGSITFKAPKTSKSRRTIALPDAAIAVLRRHRAAQAEERIRLGPAYLEHDLVLAKKRGDPWNANSIHTLFRGIVRRAGIGHVRFHDLRHTHATQLLRLGVNAKVVSERLGHSTIGITLDTYSHVMPGMQEEAARRIDVALGAVVGNLVIDGDDVETRSHLTFVGKLSAIRPVQAATRNHQNHAKSDPIRD